MGKISHGDIGSTLHKTTMEDDSYHKIGGVASLQIVRGATFVVAAANSSAQDKAQADYICDGVADNVEIQAAIDALPLIVDSAGEATLRSGEVVLMPGTYRIAATMKVGRFTAGSPYTIQQASNGIIRGAGTGVYLDVSALNDDVFQFAGRAAENTAGQAKLLSNLHFFGAEANTATRIAHILDRDGGIISDIQSYKVCNLFMFRGVCWGWEVQRVWASLSASLAGVMGIETTDNGSGQYPHAGVIQHCDLEVFQTAIKLSGSGAYCRVNNNAFEGCGTDIILDSGWGHRVYDNNFTVLGANGIGVYNKTVEANIHDNHFRLNGAASIAIKHEVSTGPVTKSRTQIANNTIASGTPGTKQGTFLSLVTYDFTGSIKGNDVTDIVTFIANGGGATPNIDAPVVGNKVDNVTDFIPTATVKRLVGANDITTISGTFLGNVDGAAQVFHNTIAYP